MATTEVVHESSLAREKSKLTMAREIPQGYAVESIVESNAMNGSHPQAQDTTLDHGRQTSKATEMQDDCVQQGNTHAVDVEKDSDADEVEEETDDQETSWFGNAFESFLESTEVTLSLAANTLREGVSETVSTVTTNLLDTEFYKNNLAYVPPVDAPASPRQSQQPEEPLTNRTSITTNPSTSPRSRVISSSVAGSGNANSTAGDRTSGFFTFAEDLLGAVETTPIEDRLRAAGQSIGYVRVLIEETRKLSPDGQLISGTTHPYVRIRLGRQQTWTSVVAREDPVRAGRFAFNKEISLVAQDINTDLAIEVRQKNVIVADSLIGQVLVPLTSIVPDVSTALANRKDDVDRRCEPYILDSWFELFPLQDGRKKFRPASLDIANTGMWQRNPPLGFIKLRIELHLHGRISMWAGYAMPASDKLMDVVTAPTPSGDLKALSAVVETGRGFKRNFQRVKTAFNRLASRGKYAWPPMRFLRRARSFEDLRVSLFVFCLAIFACLIAPPSMLPINAYLIVLASTFMGKESSLTSREYTVWNQSIRDPDDELGPVQKVAKVIYMLEKFERWMGLAADWMERMIHVFSFADERVTIAALMALGVISLALSLALTIMSPGQLVFVGFLAWFLQPALKRVTLSKHSSGTIKLTKKEKSPRHKVQTVAMPEKFLSMDDEQSLRGDGRLAQAVAIAKLVMRTPSLARNVFARVPTEDELGHRWIANLQRIPGSPPESEEDEDNESIHGTSRIEPEAETWLREL